MANFYIPRTAGAANDVALYKVQTDGSLLENGKQAVAANPRGMMVDPTGRFLLVASQNANTSRYLLLIKIMACYRMRKD
jgi:6-phosphogluconolactonase (cycloisomerase 2 family)